MNLYEVLGLQEGQYSKFPDLPLSLIKKVYRDLSKKHHPDHGGDPEVFAPIAAAYAVLSDPKKRAQYDETGVIPDGTDKVYQEAVEIVCQMVGQLVDQLVEKGLSDLQGDMVVLMKQHIQKKIAENEDVKRKLDLAQNLYANIRERTFVREDDDGDKMNVIHGVLNQRLESDARKQEQIEKAIVVLNKTLEVLDQHGCNPPEQQQQAGWSVSYSSTSGNPTTG